jgi:crotonobetainyl-CoA:carnitine CoA-transferase CaiB-like acyl-CoA transferase
MLLPLVTPDEPAPVPSRAPDAGDDTDDVLAGVLGYDPARIAALRDAGALG